MGFKVLAIPASIFEGGQQAQQIIDEFAAEAIKALKAQQPVPVIIHTCLGASHQSAATLEEVDPRIQQTAQLLISQGLTKDEITLRTAEVYGKVLGKIGLAVCQAKAVKRLVVAGGDTSSYVARAMEVTAVRMIAPFNVGAPICRAYAKAAAVDGLEVNFKGGQVGDEKYFINLLKGSL